MALFLDYDGTLREIVNDPDAAGPTDDARALFNDLAKRKDVELTIVSGRKREDLEKFFGLYPFGLVAEHGANVRLPGGAEWEAQDGEVRYEWKMQLTGVADRDTADEQFGAWKARQLAEELGVITADAPVQVRHGKKIVEVVSTQVSKGIALSRLLQEEGTGWLALCAGDDTTDESMFALQTKHLLTIKVGEGPTRARYRVADPAELIRFLCDAFIRGGNTP